GRDTRPTPDTCQNRHILAAVGPQIGDRLADDAGAGPELPENVAGGGVDCLEPPVRRPVEDYVSGCGDGAAPDGEALTDLPDHALVHRVPSGQRAAVPGLVRGIHHHVGAHIGRPRDVVRLYTFVIHAQQVLRDVDEARPRRVGRR